MSSEILGYVAMVSGIIAAITISGDFGRRITGWAFVIFTVSSITWVAVGLLDEEPPLVIQNAVLTVVNVVGIYRWLIRTKPAS
ncbi:hypothetical protein [Henriciella sp.]|uniref:hypothetical protein n=1 Tax=Henriciella sp. TaxID=1968823 RepID=UPI0026208AC7|nr:hypothetical protein [Henriciella sp.]